VILSRVLGVAIMLGLAVVSTIDARQAPSELDWKVVRKGRDVSVKVPRHGRLLARRAVIEYANRPQLLSVRTAADRAGPAYVLVVDGIPFTLSVPDGIEPRIEYVATDAPGFVTPGGLKVGSTYRELMAQALAGIVEEPEWGFFACLPSRWTAVLACSEGRWGLAGPEKLVHKRAGGVRYCEDQAVEHRVVGWFFKRRGTCGN